MDQELLDKKLIPSQNFIAREQADNVFSIELHSNKTVVKREKPKLSLTPIPRRGGGIRDSIKCLSPESRVRFIDKAHSIENLNHELVLTYPSSAVPTEGRAVHRHWRRMSRWLVESQLVGGIYMKEWSEADAAHLHVLLNGPIDKEAAAKRWAKIVGSSDPNHVLHGVYTKPIGNVFKAITYLAKLEQKRPPDGYQGIGRYWAEFGPITYKPVTVIEGTREQLAPAIRAVRALETSRRRSRGRKPRKDNGRFSFAVREVRTSTVKGSLDRILEPTAVSTKVVERRRGYSAQQESFRGSL